MRTIDRLRYEFGVPIEYDESNRGYYLTNPHFSFAALPPDRDELIALSLLREISTIFDESSVHDAISSLWVRLTNGRAYMDGDLERMRARFSVESAAVGRLPAVDLVRVITLCHEGHQVGITYHSPWDSYGKRELWGTFERLHLRDGTLYALFKDTGMSRHVLNLSFVQSLDEGTSSLIQDRQDASQQGVQGVWPDGIGEWSGSSAEIIEVTLAPPGSRFYASQLWHAEQEDSWNGEHLIRRFPGAISSDLLRRILSLGRYVVGVKPLSVVEQLREDVRRLTHLCGER
jgi:predicted DNA-binding transcriptional regulator YafY